LHKFGYNVQKFINETNPFRNNLIEYVRHNFTFTEKDYDDFLIDTYNYSASIISEL